MVFSCLLCLKIYQKMDNNIRNLIHIALEENNFNSLNEAYSKLKKERQSPSDKVDAVSPDLFTLCAETAFNLGQRDMAEDCIKMFFMKTPPSNQFLCRAYLCQAMLNAPTSSKKAEQLDKAVEYILKAINFAKKNPRYYFLVYNASVLYWQFCRPFLKPNFRQYLAKSLHQVVKALDDIDDKDYDWRAQLMIALIECHVDAGRKEDAVQVSNATLSFTKNYVPSLYTTVLGLQIRHRLIDISKVSKEIKASNELHIFYRIQRLRALLEAGEKVDMHQELGKIYKMAVKGGVEADRSSTETPSTPVGNFVSSPNTNGVSDKVPLLIDLTRLCLENDCHELAADCLEVLRGPTCVKDKTTSFEVEFMKFDLMVKSLGNKKENYSKNVVEARVQAIKKLEQYLITASRLENPNVIQAGCVTLWNLSLPMLQPNLRQYVRKPLTLIAQLLEDIDSLLVLLRCQVHMELAKCEEDEDQLEYALTNLQKALDMDDSGQYRDRLNTALKRLKLRATLYQTPERPEDLAAMIIEQARSSNDSSTVRMKRASLVKAGEALSPDAFIQVLDSESETKDPSCTKGPPTLLSKLAGRANQYQKAVSKADGHLKRLGNENDQERVRIWVDLAKTARKQQVWDVTRVAARFCLLYDNGRWSRRGASGRSNIQSDSDVAEEKSVGGTTKSPGPDKRGSGDANKLDPTGMKLLHPEGMTPFKKEQDILRNLAEVHFIYAEALVHLLRKEGVQLGDSPVPPEETVKLRPKRYEDQQQNVEEQPEWVTYRKWITSLSEEAIYSFQRAAELGVELNEPWLICNSAVYLWNYTNHILTQGRFKEIVPIYTPVLEAMKTAGHAGETELMCRISNAIGQGLMQPWIPVLPVQSDPTGKDKTDKQPEKAAKGRQSGKGAKGAPSKSNVPTVTVDPEATGDLKKAVDILEFMMTFTNGNDPNNLVPIAVRRPLIKSWVFCKQLLNQPIPKNLGHDDENPHSQGPMCKALCAVEMISLQGNGLPELQPCPTLPEIVKMVETSTWSDRLVEVELWSRLAVLAYNNENHTLVMHCGGKAMAFAESDQCLANKQPKKIDNVFKHKLVVEQEMLYFSSVVMGQSLIKNMQGRNEIRRDALICFVNACRFGQQAGNYDLVITAARHYWNAIKPFISEPIERELLKDPLEAVLGCIAAVARKTMGKEDEDEEEDEAGKPAEKETATKPKPAKSDKTGKDKKNKEKSADKKNDKAKGDKNKVGKASKGDSSDGKDAKGKQDKEEKTAPLPSAFDEDLMMRAAMYGVLFQAYADKCNWEQGLQAMDQAVKDMPRTHHRLLIFKHRVITNAKLGRNVLFDMGKFKNESDDVISSMWRHVALNSKDPMDQLSAYQNAIEVLETPESDWQKVEYLVEFGEWLFVNEYPKTDAMDQFLWAADILFNKTTKEGASPTQERDMDDMSESSSQDTFKYVPRQRASVIGQRPSEINIKTEEMTDVRQLETLCRIHLMLAQVAGRSSPHYTDYILIACGLLHRILEISIHSAEKMIREGGKPGERAPSKKGKDKKESQSKSEKAGAKSCLPSSMEGWSTFELPEKLQEYFKQDITGTMISKNTIKKPMLTMYYLDALVNDLCELGFHQLGLPVVVLSQIIADLLLEQEHFQRLVHLRTMQLCQQLNLLSGASLHERLSGNLYLTEQEQAKSREEIEIWKEKQRQVSFEEERTRASKSIIFDHKPSNLDNRPRGPGGLTSSDVEYEPWNKYKKVISGVKNREVWTAQAEILINQGQYQVARQLLYEANISARAFDDYSTLANILVQLAVLALAESNWGQAISFLKEAQSLKGDQKHWLRTTLLLVEACLCKIDKRSQNPYKPDKEALEKARVMIVEAKTLFQSLSENNENKANLSDYIEAVLEARLGILLSDYLVNDDNERRQDEEAFIKCNSAYQCLRGAGEKLAQLGYRREAVKVMRKQAVIKRMFADEAKTTEERHECFLEAYSILKEASNIADAVVYDAQSASPLSEMRMVSLPVQREAVEVHLELTDLMVSMFLCYSQEDRSTRELEARKGSMQKMIDDYVKSEPALLNEEQQEWQDICSSLAVDAMMQLSLVNGMAAGLPHVKAKILYSLGLCLRALAAHTSPDAETQWKENEQNPTIEGQKDTIDENQSKESKEDNQGQDGFIPADTSKSRELLKYTTQAINLNREYTTSRKYMCQAVECLSQAVQMALKAGLREIVSQACHQLVECIGVHDPSSSAQYLALYQSCYMSQCLEKILYRAQADPAVSRLAALLRQRKILNTVDYLTDHSSTVVSLNLSNLGDCEAWRRLSIMKWHLELTKEFSVTNLQFIVLQHSPDREHLYGAVLDKGRSTVASAKPAKQAGAVPVPAKAIVTRAKVNPKDLDDLIEEFCHFKSETVSELTRRNFVRHQHEQQQKMLGRVDENLSTHQEDDDMVDTELEQQEAKLQSHFQDVVAAMEAYLDPVLTKLQPALNPESISDTVVLLADDNLLRLPLESLSVFLTPRVTSLTRDFSLQFLYHRLHQSEENEHKADAKKGGGKKADKKPEKPSTAKSKPSDKKGGTKDAPAGIPKEGPVVDINNLRYIVDLHNECSDEVDSPVKVMTDIIANYKTFSGKWTGAMGTDHLPSIGEFQNFLHESSVFLFYGTERCLGSLQPHMLTPMNLTECNAAIIMDLVHTSDSFIRQSRDDSAKSVSEISLENPLECAMLFSLAGVGCVMTNTWHGQLQDNKNKLLKYFSVLLEESKTVGQAVRSLIEFPKPPEPEPDAENSSEKGSKHGGTRKNSNAQGQNPQTVEKMEDPPREPLLPPPRHWFNTVMYGAPTIQFTPT